MNKSDLRVSLSRKRKNLDPTTVDDLSLQIANQVNGMQIWHLRTFHLFLPIAKNREVNTTFLLHLLQGRDKDIILPKTDFKNKSMQHLLLTDSTVISENKLGIPEPQEGISIPPGQIDVVFVPLLAADRSGHRLGYGGGFYDRFLASCRPDCLKIGLSLFDLLPNLLPTEPHDIALDYCVTPSQVYKF